jgi:acyl carrier protein
MLNRLGQFARSQGLDSVELPFVATTKNRPAFEFLEGLVAPSHPKTGDEGVFYSIPIDHAATVSYTSGPAAAPVNHREAFGESANGYPVGSVRVKTLRRIADELRTPEQIHLATSAGLRPSAARSARSGGADASQKPFSPVEQAIADIWSEVLGVTSVRFDEDFFDLGGDSLRAALVIARLRQVFGVILPLDDIFEAPTVAGLAVVVLERLTESLEDEEMVSLLAGLGDP